VTFAAAGLISTVDQQRRSDARTWAVMYLGVLGVSAVLGLLTLRSVPSPFALPLTMLLLASVLVTVSPVSGIYLVTFFTLMTDASISPSYPFAKNLSSRESILYVSDSLNLSPLELLLLLTLSAWLLRLLLDRQSPPFVRGRLLRPVLIFTGFVVMGIVFGIGTGGDRYAAVWEFRPFLYVPIMYLLLTNLFTNRRQYRRLAVVALVALLIHSLLALQTLSTLSATARKSLESLVAHGSAIQMSVVLLVALAAWLLPGVPRWARLSLPLAAIPVGWVWLVSQRRAAVIGLAVSVILLFLLMTKLNPRTLRKVAPVFIVLTVGYLGAFWHSQGTFGFPAQALKTVIAPGEISQRDRSSDLYRQIENFDISATIHAKPITGLGFGQKFYRPLALPDISFFPFYEYIPHNSILWIWIKLGVGGFIAMLYLFGSAIRSGTRAVLRLPRGRDALVALAATSYLVMYLVFAYVDIAWDGRSMISVAIAMAVCSEYLLLPSGRRERVAAVPGPVPIAPARPLAHTGG
jgi:hypothetical protein